MSEYQIRFLVENYYDVQKLRIETFNRIVAYCKSHSDIETRDKNASQPVSANQRKRASHQSDENHALGASHGANEIQTPPASHRKSEIHLVGASQLKSANHTENASQQQDANHRESASHLKQETHNDNASQQNPETQAENAKPSVIAKQFLTLKIPVPSDIKDLVWYYHTLSETEKQLAKRLDRWSKMNPLRLAYLSKIQGIGPIFSSALLAWIAPISRFDNISKLWKYCGLAPGQKRRKGEKLGYNPHLKTLMWKIASSFEKQNIKKSRYRRLYLQIKKKYAEREDLKKAVDDEVKGAKLHIRLMAMRYTVKRFLADLWLTWREQEKLPITQPYVIDQLKHKDYESPETDKE